MHFKTTIVALLGLLTSCASHELRVSGGGALTNLHGRTAGISETAENGSTLRGRVELNQPTDLGIDAGLYMDFGGGSGYSTGDDVDSLHLASGGIFREHLSDGEVRPFLEGRLGYRHTWLDVGGEQGNGPGLDAGGGVGLEVGPAFLLLEYSTTVYDIKNEFSGRTEEFGVMIGGTISF